MAVEGGTVSHYYILVIRKFIDFMSLFRHRVWFLQWLHRFAASSARWFKNLQGCRDCRLRYAISVPKDKCDMRKKRRRNKRSPILKKQRFRI